MVIQWTTWEREEWLHKGTWYQVNASGADWVPAELQQQYKQFVIDVDWSIKTQTCHEKIWALHTQLKELAIPHLFYNSYSTFSEIQNHLNWGTSYLKPYSDHGSYTAVLKQNGHVPTKGYHFDAKGHCFWANYVLQYIKQNNLINTDALPTN